MAPPAIALIAGARPNFIKTAPLWHALRQYAKYRVFLIDTGQHPQADMSGNILKALGVSGVDVVLPGKENSITRETARIATTLEPVLKTLKPAWVVVIGDVTSTLAAALTTRQLGLPLAHIEAGLRSGDRRMPEEMNRIAVDHLADLLFASEESAVTNLIQEGIPDERIYFSGNILIDALNRVLPQARLLTATRSNLARLPAPGQDYALFTFHRPDNVDHKPLLVRILDLLDQVSRRIPVLFSLHPRTRRRLEESFLMSSLKQLKRVTLLPPLNYPEWVALLMNSRFVGTDSGGIQEETTYLGIPCLTFRDNTERPATLTYGTNTLIRNLNPASAEQHIDVILAGKYRQGTLPPRWDGQAADRIAAVLTGNIKI